MKWMTIVKIIYSRWKIVLWASFVLRQPTGQFLFGDRNSRCLNAFFSSFSAPLMVSIALSFEADLTRDTFKICFFDCRPVYLLCGELMQVTRIKRTVWVVPHRVICSVIILVFHLIGDFTLFHWFLLNSHLLPYFPNFFLFLFTRVITPNIDHSHLYFFLLNFYRCT